MNFFELQTSSMPKGLWFDALTKLAQLGLVIPRIKYSLRIGQIYGSRWVDKKLIHSPWLIIVLVKLNELTG
ncbi:hypothetical protein [Moorena producens]|uniref:hypothetical protein n=1 Tax=Moorena producens TaxID=1155739 RepID=UPI003C7781AC